MGTVSSSELESEEEDEESDEAARLLRLRLRFRGRFGLTAVAGIVPTDFTLVSCHAQRR